MDNSLVSSNEISYFIDRIRHNGKQCPVPLSRVAAPAKLKVTSTESLNISDIRENSYSLQRSDILDDYHRVGDAFSIPCDAPDPTPARVVANMKVSKKSVTPRCKVGPGIITYELFIALQARAELPSINTPELLRGELGHIAECICRFLNQERVYDMEQVIIGPSLSLIRVFEFLCSLQVPGVTETDIDRLVTSIGLEFQEKDASLFGDIPLGFLNKVIFLNS